MTIIAKKRWRFLLLFLSGILTGLTLIFPSLGFLEWLTLVPVGIFLLEVASDPTVRLRRLYGYGFFFFYCFYLTVFHWFINLYPLDFIDGMTKGGALAVVLAAWLGLSLIQTLFGGLLFVLLGILFRGRIANRYPLIRPLLAAGTWAVYEWTQTLGWWGVPWGRLPLGQTKYLLGLQTASWFGSYFVTFLLVAVNFLGAFALCSLFKEKRDAWKQKTTRLACFLVVSFVIFQYTAGALIPMLSPKEGETVRVAAVQANISSHEKWSPSSIVRTREIYREYTLKAAEEGAEIILWAESALPYTIQEGSSLWNFLTELSAEANATLVVGMFVEGDGGDYNALVAFTPDGKTADVAYYKRHLVPFGEYVPMEALIQRVIPPLEELVMSAGAILPGTDANVFSLAEGEIGALICFDSIYEDLTRESVREGAELLLLATNDSWFTDSAALYMHNGQAQLRAIESGRWFVRAANTGISTVVSDRGEVIADLDPLIEGMICEDVFLRTHTTLYMRIGNLFVYLWGVLLVGFLSAETFFAVKRTKKSQ